MVALRSCVAAVLLLELACTQKPLIEDGALDQGYLHDIVRRASSASGLRVVTPLSAEVVTRDQLRALLGQEAATQIYSTDRMSAEAAMGLPSARDDSGVGLLSRVTTGLYLPRKRTLYLIHERAQGLDGSIHLRSHGQLDQEVTLAHEVVHALQHQHFPHLFDPTTFPEGHSDASSALHAAIEGSAMLAAANTLGFLGRPREPDDVISDSRSAGPLADEHPLVRERMSFPYYYGYRIAYDTGKKLLDSPPASTEQVIHDRRRSFLAFDLSALRTVARAQGCRTLYEDTLGEFGTSLWLRGIRHDADARVAQGWDGDRWVALECANHAEIAWISRWDTEKDAIEFEEQIAVIADDLVRVSEFASPIVRNRDGRELVMTSSSFPIQPSRILELANRARVTTRDELAAHFRNAK